MNRRSIGRKLGIIAFISAMLNGQRAMPEGTTYKDLAERKAGLLTNYGRYPYPPQPLNQRQKRNRQTQNFK